MNAPMLALGASWGVPRVTARGDDVSPAAPVAPRAGAPPLPGDAPPPWANAWRLLILGAGAGSSSGGPDPACASAAGGPNKLEPGARAKTPSPPRKGPLPLRVWVPAARRSPSCWALWPPDAGGDDAVVKPSRGTAPGRTAPGLPPAPGLRPTPAPGLPLRSSSPTPDRLRRSVLRLASSEPEGLRLCSPPGASGAANTPGAGPLGAKRLADCWPVALSVVFSRWVRPHGDSAADMLVAFASPPQQSTAGQDGQPPGRSATPISTRKSSHGKAACCSALAGRVVGVQPATWHPLSPPPSHYGRLG